MDNKTDKHKKIQKEKQHLRKMLENEEDSIFREKKKKYYRDSSSGMRFR